MVKEGGKMRQLARMRQSRTEATDNGERIWKSSVSGVRCYLQGEEPK